VVEQKGSTAIAALDEAKDLLLVRHYRKPTEKGVFGGG